MRQDSMTVPLSAPGLWLVGLERGLLLAGLSIALGGLAGRGLARHFKGQAPAGLPEPWAMAGCSVGLAASAALTLTALLAPGLAANLAHPQVLWLGQVATAIIAEAELICFAVAALLLHRRQSAVAPLLGVVLAEAIRAHPDAMIPAAGAFLTVCHLLPAVLWAGMLVYVLRIAIAWRDDPAAVRGLVRLYANAAAWLFAVVIITGIITAVLLVPIGSVLTTAYGKFLIVKAALVAVAAALAFAGRVSLGRKPAEAGAPTRVITWERTAVAAVLVVTGILTVITPPAKSVYSATPKPVAHVSHVPYDGSRGHR